MPVLVFALQFKGNAAPSAGADGKLSARTTARGQIHRTTLGADGVRGRVQSAAGASASFDSEVEVGDDGAFLESGRIRYGRAGSLTFQTVGRGTLGPSGLEGIQRGAVIWEVTGGDRAFAGATGLITSNFTVDAQGKVIDNQFAQLFLPDRPPARTAARVSARPPRAAAPRPSRLAARRRR
jgi:hypothetical protein